MPLYVVAYELEGVPPVSLASKGANHVLDRVLGALRTVAVLGDKTLNKHRDDDVDVILS